MRVAPLVGPDTLKPMLDRIIQVARRRGVTRGERLRVDTTVVETNIHYPTDRALLADGVRVLTRTVQRVVTQIRDVKLRVGDRTCSVGRRVFEIVQRSLATGAARREPGRRARRG